MSLIIGGITIPGLAGFSLKQTYQPILARTLKRSKNGTLTIQSRYRKLQSRISGSGWLPDGLDAIDTDAPQAVSCIHGLSIAAASNVITIPRPFRTDSGFTVQGVAIVNDQSVVTSVALAGSVATLTPVAGASQYHILYYPVLTCAISINRQFDEDTQTWSFDIEAIEA